MGYFKGICNLFFVYYLTLQHCPVYKWLLYFQAAATYLGKHGWTTHRWAICIATREYRLENISIFEH